jgi:hypothetical protein
MTADQPPVDEDFLAEQLDGILDAIRAANTPKAVELEVEARAERIRGELEPDGVRVEAE